MEAILSIVDNFFVTCTGFLFGPIMLVVFFGTGLLMTLVTRGVQFRKFGTAVREVLGDLRRKDSGDGQLKPFQALATALVILTSGVGDIVASGGLAVTETAAISNAAWTTTLGTLGDIVVTLCLVLFCFSTTIGWETYGESVWQYLFGSRSINVFRVFHVAMTFLGFVISAQILWDAADFCNGVMCIPNLFSLILFAGIIAKDTKEYIDPLR